jgi:hypothetical protein
MICAILPGEEAGKKRFTTFRDNNKIFAAIAAQVTYLPPSHTHTPFSPSREGFSLGAFGSLFIVPSVRTFYMMAMDSLPELIPPMVGAGMTEKAGMTCGRSHSALYLFGLGVRTFLRSVQ